jgi:broad specificity phosphatase PhoE
VLILVRHGRTAANAKGVLNGRNDVPLDEVGERQAKAVANSIGRIDRMIVSPLRRAQQTAEAFGVPFETDERWIEIDYGEFEGKPFGELPPGTWDHWRQDSSFTPPGGESLDALDARVRGACEELLEEVKSRDVVVVSHVSPIKSAVLWGLGATVGLSFRCHLDHASVCRVGSSPSGSLTLVSFNDTGHLR